MQAVLRFLSRFLPFLLRWVQSQDTVQPQVKAKRKMNQDRALKIVKRWAEQRDRRGGSN